MEKGRQCSCEGSIEIGVAERERLGMGPLAGCCADGDELSGFVKYWQLFECPSEYYIVKGSGERSSLVGLFFR